MSEKAPVSRALGLDISATATGIVVLQATASARPKLLEERTFKPKTKGFQRCSDVAQAVMDAIEVFEPNEVVVEGYGYANAHTLATLVEVGTVVRYFLLQHGWKFLELTPNGLKKFVTGKGNAAKDKMQLSVYERWGHKPANADTADAFGLAAAGLAYHGRMLKLDAKQKDALDNLRRAA